MEYLKTYYSLERHLEETIKYNPQFEILNSIWKLNKKSLSLALNNVSQYFPHYSLHDKSHSNTIINNIESFLGEERIKKLSPTNTWLLLMASFTHDLGMVVFQDVIERDWNSSEFQEFLKDICNWEDIELSRSGRILSALKDVKEYNNIDFDPILIKNSVTLVVAEYMRRFHHKRSSDILKGIDKTFSEVAKNFYSDQIPNRLLSLLGDIAYLHGVEFYEIFKRLDYESNGISNDKIHPRFIAAMLRLGDLLDIDDGRFNAFTSKIFRQPESSNLHAQKHSSIKHFLVNPFAIEITADCQEEEVYRLARSWFDWLEIEVENLNKEWSTMAPNDLGGSAPRIPKGKIKVFLKGSMADERFLNLKFQVANNKIFEILEGGSIYEKAELTFLRELVQNSIDASKIQLWREIQKGTYDFAFQNALKKGMTHDEIISNIKFPIDIPDEIIDSYPILLDISWEDSSRKNLIIEVSDNGTGISEVDLLRMTNKVGESRKGNKEYKIFLESMPFWLRPTGAFGIGLQSLFILVDSFKVTTKAEGETGKVIFFRSAKRNKYSTISEDHSVKQRGTKVTITLPSEQFSKAFGSSFDWGIIAEYDHFTDDFGNIYIHKIKKYILETLSEVNNLSATILSKRIKFERDSIQMESLSDSPETDGKISASLFIKGNYVALNFYESIIGSQFILYFFADHKEGSERNWPLYETDFFVRDIPVESNLIHYYVLSYSKLHWNFMSPESDKILSITREKFIEKNKKEIEHKFQHTVLKNALQLSVRFFSGSYLDKLKKKFDGSIDKLSMIYFKFLLTLKVNLVEIQELNTYLLSYDLDIQFACLKDKTAVKYKDFLDADELLVPVLFVYPGSQKLVNTTKEQLAEKLVSQDSSKIIIWNSSFFKFYFIRNYYIQELQYSDNGYLVLLKKGEVSSDNIKIEVGVNYYFEQFLSISKRLWSYSYNKYSNILNVYNEYGSGFEDFPYLSKTSIISPFNSESQLDEICQDLGVNFGNSLERVDMEQRLSESIIRKYVTLSLIDWIKKYSPNSNTLIENEILNAYKYFIIDILMLKMGNENQV